jgi:methyl-accepting chemotaxis protein
VVIESNPPSTRKRRRIFVIDSAMRWPMGLTIAGVVAAGALLMVTRGQLVGAGEGSELTGAGIGRLALMWQALYFVTALMLVVWYAVVVSHRVAGPTRVLRRALDGILEGDFGRRVSLRKKDHLKEIAEGIGKVANRMRLDREELRAFAQEIEACLSRDDVVAARDALASFRAKKRLDAAEPAVVVEPMSDAELPANGPGSSPRDR